jgi:hypothetical protein
MLTVRGLSDGAVDSLEELLFDLSDFTLYIISLLQL